jgi:hypothetical protein
MNAPSIRLDSIELYERATTLRLPFKFGAATVTQCPQAFVRVQLSVDGITGVEGASAELMVPKWFDKSPTLSHDNNFDQLRLSCQLAKAAYLETTGQSEKPRHAFAVSQIAGQASIFLALAQGLPRLAAQFGPALIDKAVADALLRARQISWTQGLQSGLLGDPYSARLTIASPTRVFLRHTVGLLDRLQDSDPNPPASDGLPSSLEGAIKAYGLQYFKIKLCGRIEEDIERLENIGAVLNPLPHYQVTLDGNETFTDTEGLALYWGKLANHAPLAGLLQRTLLLEQPLARSVALNQSIRSLGIQVPVIMDESDDHPEVLNKGLALGYGGISSKACKGIYRSLQSAFLLAQRRDQAPHLLLCGEDLTCQAGLAVQQDTLLAASLGIAHIERNGHHYVDGFGIAPDSEAMRFAKAHPSLYHANAHRRPRLRITAGQLDLQSLYVPGFASKVMPQWESLAEMRSFSTPPSGSSLL